MMQIRRKRLFEIDHVNVYAEIGSAKIALDNIQTEQSDQIDTSF